MCVPCITSACDRSRFPRLLAGYVILVMVIQKLDESVSRTSRPMDQEQSGGDREFMFVMNALTRSMSGFRLTTKWPNHALRTRRERRGCNRYVPCAGSLSLDRSAKV